MQSPIYLVNEGTPTFSPRTALAIISGFCSAFQIRSALTNLPVMRHCARVLHCELEAAKPSGVTANQFNVPLSPGKLISVTKCRPVPESQRRTNPSKLPDAASLPFGLRAAAYVTDPTGNVRSIAPLVPSQSRTVRSPPAEATSLPSLLKQISCTALPWPRCKRVRSPFCGFHQYRPLSYPDVTTDLPSGCTATASTSCSMPLNVIMLLPVSGSMMRAVRSLLLDTSHLPSGLKATE